MLPGTNTVTFPHPFVVSLSNLERSHFDKLSANGGSQRIRHRNYGQQHLALRLVSSDAFVGRWIPDAGTIHGRDGSQFRERMNMVEEYPARRKHARLTFGEPASGAITSSHEAQVLELSLGGARIEHTMILRPGSSCYLRLPLSEGILTANCIIIWSRVVDRAADEQGGSGLLFHTGVQFGNLTREAQALLDAYLQGRSE